MGVACVAGSLTQTSAEQGRGLTRVPQPTPLGAAWTLFTEVVQRDLEGVAAKLRQAPYGLVDGHSPWIKIKNREDTQAVGRHEQFDGLRGERRLARRA
jgi:ATP-dependent DNA ligase